VQRWLSLVASVAVALSAASCHRTRGAPLDFDAELAAARETLLKQGPPAAIPAYERILAAARSSHSRKYEALTLGLAADAVALRLLDARGMRLDPDAEVGAEVEGLLVGEPELFRKLVDSDLACQRA